MKLNQEWQQQWESIEVPEQKLTQMIEETVAEPKKLTLSEKIKAAVHTGKSVKTKFRRRTWYVLAAGAVVLLAGTGMYWSQRETMKYSSNSASMNAVPTGEGMIEMEEAPSNAKTEADTESATQAAGAGEAEKAEASIVSEKTARFYNYSKQTTDFSGDIEKLEKLIDESGSYIETSNRSNWSGDLQSAYYKIRIPEKEGNSKDTLEKLRKIGDTIDETVRTENYSAAYTDNESRIKALETEETALLGMLEKSDKLEDMLKIQERLSTVRAERENLVRANKVIDNQVDYVTVEVSIDEVNQVEKKQESPSLTTRISGNLEKQKLFWKEKAENVIVFAASNSIYFLIGLVAILIVVYSVRKKSKKKGKKNTDVEKSE
ncbi:DUF4349 domain-containing protein [Enterococcus sp. BWR-S5]|uniref:DUF4349 domain-containing protein n=1 Tax=Enterococcus sp. BWR-S5 TaxID=2787714 RepID=UPI00192370FF|nr:DUF4349 domain-containing protein [Enterococcus sp. BWR-S5]MBL1224313.1 DUF4349 domain-containing protein [Enterococcus sp. BWR-S5]